MSLWVEQKVQGGGEHAETGRLVRKLPGPWVLHCGCGRIGIQ